MHRDFSPRSQRNSFGKSRGPAQIIRCRIAAALCLLACYLSASPALAAGETRIEFELQAKFTDVDGDLIWVQNTPLQPADIAILPERDPALATALAELLNNSQQRQDDLENYSTRLRDFLDPQHRLPEGDQSPLQISGFSGFPPDPVADQTTTLSIKILLPAMPGTERIDIYLVSRSCSFTFAYEGGEVPVGHQVDGPWSLASLQETFSLPPGQATKENREAITAQVIYSPADVEEFGLKNGIPAPEAKRRLILQYQALAAQYMTNLLDAGLRPGVLLQEEQAQQKASAIHGAIYPFSPPAPSAKHEKTGKPVFQFFFPGFGLREKATIEVAGDPGAQAKFEQRYLDFSPAGRKRRLLMDGTRLPSSAMIEADLQFLREDPLIASARRKESPEEVVYVLVPTVLSKRGFTVRAGAEYTPQRQLTPILGLQVPARNEEESDFRFELSGGEHSISGDIEYLFPLSRKTRGNFWDSAQGLIRAGAESVKDAPYGNTIREGVDSTVQDFAAGVIFRSDSFGHSDRFEAVQPGFDPPPGGRWFNTLETGFRFRNTTLDGAAPSLTGLDEGARSGPYAVAQFLYGDPLGLRSRKDFSTSGWFEGKIALDTSLEALGGESDYLRIFTEVRGRRSWRLSDRVAGQVGLGVSACWASGGTPTFDYFGAGEEGLIRGLRATEFIGRSFVGCHADLGFDVTPLLGKVLGDRASADSGMLILFGPFADAGWLSHRIENGRHVSGHRALQSFGLQLEILQLSIARAPVTMAVGYGWSPQSDLDQSGSIFSRVSLRF